MPRINTRPYRDSDWQKASVIHDLARPIELEGSCDPRAFVPLAEDKSDLLQFNTCQKTVACIDNQVVGFIGVSGNEIGWLYVHPTNHGKGVGRRLLRTVLHQVTCDTCVYVLDGNSRALNLYLSEGFEVLESFKSNNNGYPCTVLTLLRREPRP